MHRSNKIFSPEELENHSVDKLNDVVKKNNPYKIVDECFRMFSGKDVKDAGLKFDLLYFLPDQLLTKVDIASMAVSLEARSPLLDHKIIDLAGSIPFDLKVKNGESKYIFKKALEKIVPKENLYRPKVGFTIPLDRWFSGKLNGFARNTLLSKNSMVKDLFNKEYIKTMIKDKNKSQDFGPRLWALMSLELWLRAYFV